VTQVVHVRKFPFVQFAPNCVYIGRDYLEFKDEGWGNPFHVGPDGNRKVVLEKYRVWIKNQPHLIARLSELKDKILGCWCREKNGFRGKVVCHGQILAGLVDGTPPEQIE
jgi:hypothetical protein